MLKLMNIGFERTFKVIVTGLLVTNVFYYMWLWETEGIYGDAGGSGSFFKFLNDNPRNPEVYIAGCFLILFFVNLLLDYNKVNRKFLLRYVSVLLIATFANMIAYRNLWGVSATYIIFPLFFIAFYTLLPMYIMLVDKSSYRMIHCTLCLLPIFVMLFFSLYSFIGRPAWSNITQDSSYYLHCQDVHRGIFSGIYGNRCSR